MTWQDARGAGYDVYAQHLDADGDLVAGWPSGGVAVCTADGDQTTPVVTSDGGAGAIVAWDDTRGIEPQVYAAHVTADGVVPTLASLVSVAASCDDVRLEWFAGVWRTRAITVERRTDGSTWRALAVVSPDGSGRLEYVDRAVLPGARYEYRLMLGSGAASEPAGETWVSVPLRPGLALEAPDPNPSIGTIRCAVIAAGRQRCLARGVRLEWPAGLPARRRNAGRRPTRDHHRRACPGRPGALRDASRAIQPNADAAGDRYTIVAACRGLPQRCDSRGQLASQSCGHSDVALEGLRRSKRRAQRRTTSHVLGGAGRGVVYGNRR